MIGYLRRLGAVAATMAGVNVAIRGGGRDQPSVPSSAPTTSLKVCTMSVDYSVVDHMRLEPGNGIPVKGDSGAGVWFGDRIYGIYVSYDGDHSYGYAVQTSVVAGWIEGATDIPGEG
ncbi:hypothetical protein E1091_02545 [Micromonospora fluostatini]|uniref:Peptidase S1 domain-containing protein n=1 Tax=Micromonospora fluostatini TaxID=1629071 RepID=A0ABY2DLU5_9ACTN|nr:hypothetical protein E1091_02545 [Micromonospora fluostatini]